MRDSISLNRDYIISGETISDLVEAYNQGRQSLVVILFLGETFA